MSKEDFWNTLCMPADIDIDCETCKHRNGRGEACWRLSTEGDDECVLYRTPTIEYPLWEWDGETYE